MAITIRCLQSRDWEIFRSFWLEGLSGYPHFFGGADAHDIVPQMWRTIVQGPTHQFFGLFDDTNLIGITAAFARREDTADQTAIFGMSFIQPAWRGQGLSRLLYDARLEWTRAHPNFKRVELSHRSSNAASRGAHRRYGFVLTGKALQPGPDGQSGPEEYYELAVAR